MNIFNEENNGDFNEKSNEEFTKESTEIDSEGFSGKNYECNLNIVEMHCRTW